MLNTFRNYFRAIAVSDICNSRLAGSLRVVQFPVPTSLCWLARCQSGTTGQNQVDFVGSRALELYWANGEEFQCILVGLELLFGWAKPLFLERPHRGLAVCVCGKSRI